MTQYRKLTDDDLLTFGITINSKKHDKLIKHVNLHYPKTAAKVLIIVDSEYDDSFYNNTIKSIIVYDNESNILSPLKGKEIDALKKLPEQVDETKWSGEDPDSIDDFVVYLSSPELYVKVDE